MDYPQYVLERQRAALAALLLGWTEARGYGEEDRTRRNTKETERGQAVSGSLFSGRYPEGSPSPRRSAESRPKAERVSREPEEAGRSAGAWAGASGGHRKERQDPDGPPAVQKRRRSEGTGAPLPEGALRETERAAGPERERKEPDRTAGRTGGVWATPLEGFGGWGASLSAGTDGPWSGGGTAASARALSLAVQRDARRYDGGFAPY